jgi:DNA-binding response OmpR family regulator
MNETSKKILIVDDEPDMLDYLSSFLKDNGFNVLIATNGKEAFNVAKQELPDLITLDISMPEESGVRAFRNLQEAPETKEIPIMIITGLSKDFKKFISTRKVVHPPDAYMEKPINPSEFLEKVKSILNFG